MSAESAVTDCLQQLRRLLDKDDDFGQQCYSVEDLCRLLADGEVLCCLLSVLSNGQVSPDADETGSFYSINSELLGRRNVAFFLKKCKEYFKLPNNALFEPNDLLLLKQPDKVLAALQHLLQLAKNKPSETPRLRRLSEETYTEIDTQSQAVSQLENIVVEIRHLENQIVVRLSNLGKFRHELMSLLSEWSPDLVESTFCHMAQLLKVHGNFKQRLDELAQQGALAFCVGLDSAFKEIKPDLSAIYGKFFSNHLLAKAQLDKEFAANPYLSRQLKLLEEHFKTESFSLMYDSPLKQVFNYQLLFDRLLSTLGKEVPDTKADSEKAVSSVENALQECRRLLCHLNEKKRCSEHAAATKQLLQSVYGLPEQLGHLENVGLHRGDGQFRMRLGKDVNSSISDCYCLLTDQHLIVARVTSTSGTQPRLEFLFEVPLSEGELQLECIVGDPDGLQLKQARIGLVQFSRASGGGGKSKSSSSGFGSNLWTQLAETLAKNFPSGYKTAGHHFQRVTVPEDSVCSRCNEILVGLYFQGYYCEHCQQLLDRSCLSALLRRQRPVSYPEGNQAMNYGEHLVHSHLNRKSAELMLKRYRPGAYLLRQSAGQKIVLSIRWQPEETYIKHVIVQQRQIGSTGPRQYSVDPKNGQWHASLVQLVAHYEINSLTIGNVAGVRLLELIPPAICDNHS